MSSERPQWNENLGRWLASFIFDSDSRSVDYTALAGLAFFYLVVLAVGVWAGWRQRQTSNEADIETWMVAGRRLGGVVGVLTLAATWVGGGFINGSAQVAFTSGVVWVQAPFLYSLSLILTGTFFARKMREAEYLTMIDPFTQKFGRWGSLQAFPAAISEIFWSSSILSALGSTLNVILGIRTSAAIIISAFISVMYTLMGGLVSVAYTDVIQIAFITLGLFLSLPFAAYNPSVSDLWSTEWTGEVKSHQMGEWIDFALLLLFGGVPWQCYYQRVLSSKSANRAMWLSYGGCVIAITLAIPSLLFGLVAKATEWSETDFGRVPTEDEAIMVLPLCLRYLTPGWVAFFGLGGISAAVMSSSDSSMLSASSMLSRNVYKTIVRPSASDREVIAVLWLFIVLSALTATVLAIVYKNIYGLFVLCGDLVYVIVFPQLLLVLYFERVNTYGSVSSFFIGFLLRILCGDGLLGLPALISFGSLHNADDPSQPGPLPFRTITMLISMVVHVAISSATHYVFTNKKLPLIYDFMQCFQEESESGLISSSSSRFLTAELNGLEMEPKSFNKTQRSDEAYINRAYYQ